MTINADPRTCFNCWTWLHWRWWIRHDCWPTGITSDDEPHLIRVTTYEYGFAFHCVLGMHLFMDNFRWRLKNIFISTGGCWYNSTTMVKSTIVNGRMIKDVCWLKFYFLLWSDQYKFVDICVSSWHLGEVTNNMLMVFQSPHIIMLFLSSKPLRARVGYDIMLNTGCFN